MLVDTEVLVDSWENICNLPVTGNITKQWSKSGFYETFHQAKMMGRNVILPTFVAAHSRCASQGVQLTLGLQQIEANGNRDVTYYMATDLGPVRATHRKKILLLLHGFFQTAMPQLDQKSHKTQTYTTQAAYTMDGKEVVQPESALLIPIFYSN